MDRLWIGEHVSMFIFSPSLSCRLSSCDCVFYASSSLSSPSDVSSLYLASFSSPWQVPEGRRFQTYGHL